MRLTSSRLWGKLLPPERKKGKGRKEGALRREKREGAGAGRGSPPHPGLSAWWPCPVRCGRASCRSRSRHPVPVRHSGCRLSLSADNVLTSSFFFQNYYLERGSRRVRSPDRLRSTDRHNRQSACDTRKGEAAGQGQALRIRHGLRINSVRRGALRSNMPRSSQALARSRNDTSRHASFLVCSARPSLTLTSHCSRMFGISGRRRRTRGRRRAGPAAHVCPSVHVHGHVCCSPLPRSLITFLPPFLPSFLPSFSHSNRPCAMNLFTPSSARLSFVTPRPACLLLLSSFIILYSSRSTVHMSKQQ